MFTSFTLYLQKYAQSATPVIIQLDHCVFLNQFRKQIKTDWTFAADKLVTHRKILSLTQTQNNLKYTFIISAFYHYCFNVRKRKTSGWGFKYSLYKQVYETEKPWMSATDITDNKRCDYSSKTLSEISICIL